jgi:hypothetical protein
MHWFKLLTDKFEPMELVKLIIEAVTVPAIMSDANMAHSYLHAARARPDVAEDDRKAIADAAVKGLLENLS